MEISPPGMNSAMTAVTRQLQTTTEMQISVMKQIAEGQQQMAEMLQSLGIGSHIDLRA